jgi:hypothetical protein
MYAFMYADLTDEIICCEHEVITMEVIQNKFHLEN